VSSERSASYVTALSSSDINFVNQILEVCHISAEYLFNDTWKSWKAAQHGCCISKYGSFNNILQ
jgi:hypothetical protein